MRFIPYSVLGGFFAGTGWLLTIAGLRVMTGLEQSSIAEVPALADADLLGRWLPGFVLALAIFAVIRFVSFAVALPLVLIVATSLFFILMLGNGETVETLGRSGWLLGPFFKSAIDPLGLVDGHLLEYEDWSVVLGQWTISIFSSKERFRSIFNCPTEA
jgi:MFS superfamily sulfate permease-like transporter